MEHRIGLIGCGNVGRGLLEILRDKGGYLRDACDFEARVVAITDRRGTIMAEDGIDLSLLLDILGKGGKLSDYPKKRGARTELLSPLDLLERTEAGIIAELSATNFRTGEPAAGYIKKALRNGKHVVTSNKGPVALHYREIRDIAQSSGLQFRFEGTVMSGVPVFHLAEYGLAGNDFRGFKGILNGTTNFMLTMMETEGLEFDKALARAGELGYVEAEPGADIEGWDAAAKAVILADVLLGGSLSPADIKREGIAGLTMEDILKAAREGLRYKLVAEASRVNDDVTASVTLRELPLADPLASVMGVGTAVSLDTDLAGRVTLFGAGGGGRETGFAVLSDMLDIHRSVSRLENGRHFPYNDRALARGRSSVG